MIPWEFHDGARSWLMPGLVALVMRPAAWLSATPSFYLGAVWLEFAALAVFPVWAAWDIGRRLSTEHAVCAAFAVAAGLGIEELGIRTLSEVVAADFFLPAIALLTGPATRRRMVLGGLAMGAAVAFRVHLVPAAALVAILGCRMEWRTRWLPAVAAGLVPVVFLGVLDWATWGVPFASIVNNIAFNVVHGLATTYYGTSPADWYITEIGRRYGYLLVLLVPLILVGAVRTPSLLVAAAAVVLVHTAFGHKEYRFVYPALLCLTALAGLGFGAAVRYAKVRLRDDWTDAALLPAALGVIVVATVGASLAPVTRATFFAHGNGIAAFAALHDDPSVCGIAFADNGVYEYPGYAGLHRQVPFYLWSSLQAAGKTDAANVLLTPVARPLPSPLPPNVRCFDQAGDRAICAVETPRPCQPAPGLDIQSDPRWSGHTH